ncbi:hypothetical protein HMPREF0183_1365 [Brevibacterium mcbrellneri ATCC 49030]|uniref:Uncharacterized protein n=1 Tax=Brevibacterium mcbrellneri ATCC 49030 TaxID=585530 RepID=D4YN56_9MICO|nr:hypothetical protein [Brevibacterium mcbrellneri]EFG47374.1 hypothetical protein HMPREF0183_1365 [Brevibacterium mcbrellneri ATCC 49030]
MKDTVDVTVRRSPRYSVFVGLGVIVGFIIAGILAFLPVDTSTLTQEYSQAAMLGILMAFLGIVGGFLGALVALIIDRSSVKNAKTYTVNAKYEKVTEPQNTTDAPETSEVSDTSGPEDTDTGADTSGAKPGTPPVEQ